MKLMAVLLLTILFFNFAKKPNNINPTGTNPVASSSIHDSSKIHFSNNSSLRRIPSVIRDLSIALNESMFQWEGIVSWNRFSVDLRDVVHKSFDTSATVAYRPGDTVYYITLNKFNKQASDRALAVTLIHEIMHCVLMDIDRRARYGDEKALLLTERLNQKLKNPFGIADNSFFGMMNMGDAGQHELMYQFFYKDMVCLLERFAKIHKPVFFQHEDAELLIWSGLQFTSGYQKLSFEEKRKIEFTILREKGILTSFLDY